jgi:hypothetical protein
MLQQHSEKVRLKSEVGGFLPDNNPWVAPFSPEEEYAVQLLVATRRKDQCEAEYLIRGERLRRRSSKKGSDNPVIREGEVVEVLGKFDARSDLTSADSEAVQFSETDAMLHVRNEHGIEAWIKQSMVTPVIGT